MLHYVYTEPIALHVFLNAFFLYSFMGWIMECIVIRREKGKWENRGFAHLPFCIIYGFGAMFGFAALRPLSGNYVLLYIVGSVLATTFEYLTARLMLRLFGTFWWDYTNKPFNYKGILCLESTLGWGLIAVLLFAFLHRGVFNVVMRIPTRISMGAAFLLVSAYTIDFAISMRQSLRRAHAARAGGTAAASTDAGQAAADQTAAGQTASEQEVAAKESRPHAAR